MHFLARGCLLVKAQECNDVLNDLICLYLLTRFITQYLSDQVLQHGACLGIGAALIALGRQECRGMFVGRSGRTSNVEAFYAWQQLTSVSTTS